MEYIKQLNIDYTSIILVGVIVLGAIILTRVSKWVLQRFFTSITSRVKIDHTRFKFFKNGIALIIWLMALATMVSLIPQLKAVAITLFAGAGILVAIMGLAAQQAFSNIISGLVMVIFEPFEVGDMIHVGDVERGIVEDINLRHTTINNLENRKIIIPNSLISSKTIINESVRSDSSVCNLIDFGISYDSDVNLAIAIIKDEARKCKYFQDIPIAFNDEITPLVRVMSYGDFSVNLRAYVWTESPYNNLQLKSIINKEVKRRFDAEGIEIPFPYRTLVFKDDIENAKNKLKNG